MNPMNLVSAPVLPRRRSPSAARARTPWALVASLLSIAGGSTACGSTPPPDPELPAGHRPGSEEGARLYAQYCALCHGAEGEGYAADNATRLRGQDLLRTSSDSFLSVAIGRGRPGTAMAGYASELGGPLEEAQIDAIVAHVRSWQTEPDLDLSSVSVGGDSERGARTFEAHCQSCHGTLADGGVSAQSLNRWSFLSEVSDGFLRHAIVHGREDTPMPGFGGRLSETEIDDLVVFLRAFEEEPDQLPAYLAPPSLEAMTLVRYPDAETPELTLREGRFVAAAQIRAAVEARQRIVFLDARATSDWLIRRLPGAIPVPYYMVTSSDPHDPDMAPLATRLPRDTWIIAYCGCPHAASGAVVDALRELGFERTAILDEGVYHWIGEGYPTETGPVREGDPATEP